VRELRSQKYWRNRPEDERLRNTLIPKRYRMDTLDTFKISEKDRPTWDLISNWVETAPEQVEKGQGLYICGTTGSGKTHLAQAILKRVVHNNKLCGMFITADKYIQMAYNEIKFGDDLPEGYEDPNTMKYLQDVLDIVVIDSLGSERPTDFTKRTIISLLETRYHEKLTTIVTSTLKPQMLESMYSASVASIVTSSCYIAPIKSGDNRIGQWIEHNAG
jgi:DNA replication protein DnaC